MSVTIPSASAVAEPLALPHHSRFLVLGRTAGRHVRVAISFVDDVGLRREMTITVHDGVLDAGDAVRLTRAAFVIVPEYVDDLAAELLTAPVLVGGGVS